MITRTLIELAFINGQQKIAERLETVKKPAEDILAKALAEIGKLCQAAYEAYWQAVAEPNRRYKESFIDLAEIRLKALEELRDGEPNYIPVGVYQCR